MKWLMLSLALVAAMSSAQAADRFRHRVRTTTQTTCAGGVCTTTASEDAATMARTGRFGHSGRSPQREGIGFSTRSPQEALDNCCYSGQCPVVEESVVRGRNGWYAVRRYAH